MRTSTSRHAGVRIRHLVFVTPCVACRFLYQADLLVLFQLQHLCTCAACVSFVHCQLMCLQSAQVFAVQTTCCQPDPWFAGMLTLHEADLLKEGAFDEVIRDAHFVFHTASPFFIKAEHDAQKELIDPALKGTQVRRYCAVPA